jgi:DNA repair exonuclease SbcCD ATPase subunit
VRIRRLIIHGFGNLRGEFIFSSDRCNLILEPNESGKSTMAAAILAGLYGFPRQRASREKPIKMKDRYRPWGGGPFALEMDIESAGRSLGIARDFAADTVVVRDGRSGRDVTAEFSQGRDQVEVGEALCGLTREDFQRCCFTGQREMDGLRDAGELTHALQRIATTQQGDVAAGEALQVLARATDEDYHGLLLGKGKVETEIRRLQESIQTLQAEMDAILGRRRESEGKIRRLDDLTRQEEQAEQELERLELLHLLASRDEAGAALARRERDVRERDERLAQRKELSPFATFPSTRLGRLREIKGTLASLSQRRRAAADRLEETEKAWNDASRAAAAAGSAIPPAEALSRLEARLAVLEDLWRQRSEKRSALRRERRRLSREGSDPRRAEELASRLGALADEDRRFLASHRERVLEVKNALTESERRRDRIQRDEQGRRLLVPLAAHKGKERMALLTLSAGIILSAILPFTLDNKLPVALTVLMAFAGLLWWLMLLEKRPVLGAEQFGTELQRIETEVWGHEKQMAELQDRLARLALSRGYRRTEALVEDFREMEALRAASIPLATLGAALQDARDRYTKAAEEVGRILAECGEAAPARITPRVARRFRDRLAAASGARSEMDRIGLEREAARHETAQVGLDIARIEEEIAQIAGEASASLPPDWQADNAAALDSLLALFEEGASSRERFERLQGEIEALESRDTLPLEQRVAAARADHETLAQRAGVALGNYPEGAAPVPGRSAHDYGDERRRLQERLRLVHSERQALAAEMGDLLRSLRHDYPERQALLETRTAALRRAEAFRDAVAVAADALSRQARQAYAEWADRLNDTAGRILDRLNPRYGDIRFDSDLSFTVRHTATGQRLDQKALDVHASAGARDQIYLAVRLAVSEYLSGTGVRLPFVLDDPFASFDDDRFARAMEFLLNTAGQTHQIIVLSCHETRHRAWRQAAPAPLADRLRIVDLTPLPA